MRALLADDDPLNREILTRMLAYLGWESDAVSDGYAAVDRALTDTYDVALIDLRMPGLDGYETARRIREGGSTMPLLAISGMEDLDKAKKAGLNQCLLKPFTLDELREAMKNVGRGE